MQAIDFSQVVNAVNIIALGEDVSQCINVFI